MKLFLIVLLSFLSCLCCTGYPVVESELSEDILIENGTFIESFHTTFDASNETTSDDSPLLDMHGFGKKVVNKIKDGIKTVKDKVKGGFDKVKNKIKDIKDKIGSKGGSGGGGSGGGGSGGGYYRDKYDRDYDRDRYNRDYYRKDNDYSGGSISVDPDAKWIVMGVVAFFVVGALGTILYLKLKDVYEKK